jgi:hypothetical protein
MPLAAAFNYLDDPNSSQKRTADMFSGNPLLFGTVEKDFVTPRRTIFAGAARENL